MKMTADELSCVNAGENRGLSRCALRQSINAESRVSFCHHTLERQPGFFSLKDREKFRVQSIEGIVLAASTDSYSIYEDEKYGHKSQRRCGGEEVRRRPYRLRDILDTGLLGISQGPGRLIMVTIFPRIKL